MNDYRGNFCFAWQALRLMLCGGLTIALAANGFAQASSPKAPAPVVQGERISAAKPVPAPAAAPGAKSVEQSTGTASAAVSPPAGDGLLVGFDVLGSYEFDLPNKPVFLKPGTVDEADQQIPAPIRGYEGKRVSIRGFMLPVQIRAGKVTDLLILKDPQLCCYGIVPRINDWVTVKAPGKGFEILMDQPVTVEGTLHVGSTRDSDGFVVGVYRMEGEKLILDGPGLADKSTK